MYTKYAISYVYKIYGTLYIVYINSIIYINNIYKDTRIRYVVHFLNSDRL